MDEHASCCTSYDFNKTTSYTASSLPKLVQGLCKAQTSAWCCKSWQWTSSTATSSSLFLFLRILRQILASVQQEQVWWTIAGGLFVCLIECLLILLCHYPFIYLPRNIYVLICLWGSPKCLAKFKRASQIIRSPHISSYDFLNCVAELDNFELKSSNEPHCSAL